MTNFFPILPVRSAEVCNSEKQEKENPQNACSNFKILK
jgi:hypothetical protein